MITTTTTTTNRNMKKTIQLQNIKPLKYEDLKSYINL